MEKDKPPPELCIDMEKYAQSQKLAGSIIAIAGAIPREDKDGYGIPHLLNQRSMRNAFARKSLDTLTPCDKEQLETAAKIARWLTTKISEGA